MKPIIIRAEELNEEDYGHTKDWDFSIAKVRKVGDDIKLGYDKESNVAYYVLDGNGICIINNKEYKIKKGDCLIIPKGTRYKNLKRLTLLAISYPRFDRNKRVYVE